MEKKTLDEKAYVVAKKLSDEGHFQKEIAKQMTAKGYVTSTGKAVDQTDISKLLLSHGTRKKARRVVKRDTSKRLLKDLREVMDSNISAKLKERMVRTIVDSNEFRV